MSTKTIAIIGAVIVAVLLLPLVLGGNKVTLANYEKVQMGMSYSEVKKILGNGMDQEEAFEKMKNMDFDKSAMADFEMPDMPAMPDGFKMPDMSKMPDLSDMPGMEWFSMFMTMEVYTWTKGDDKVISLGFSKDKLVMRSQVGLYNKPTMDMEGFGRIM